MKLVVRAGECIKQVIQQDFFVHQYRGAHDLELCCSVFVMMQDEGFSDEEAEASFSDASSDVSEEEGGNDEEDIDHEEARKAALAEAQAMLRDEKNESKEQYFEDEVQSQFSSLDIPPKPASSCSSCLNQENCKILAKCWQWSMCASRGSAQHRTSQVFPNQHPDQHEHMIR